MQSKPLAIQIDRVKRDRILRSALMVLALCVAQARDPFLWGFAAMAAALCVDTVAARIEDRVLERRSRRKFRILCVCYFVYFSLWSAICVRIMFSGTLPSLLFGHVVLWSTLIHCIVVRNDKTFIILSSVIPVGVALNSTILALLHLGIPAQDLIICTGLSAATTVYILKIVFTSVLQKDELHRARQFAFEAMRTKERFFATISHEIRTPLNGVLGMAQILEAEATGPSERERARTLTQSCTNLRVLIDDMLDHAKLSEGKFTITPAPTDLADMVSTVTDLFRDTAAQKGLVLRTTFVGRNPDHVLLDAVRVRQVLSNLVSNAIKYTDTGEIVVSVSTRWRGPTPWLSLCVSDTGTGIAPDKLDLIFDPYRQLEDAQSKAGIGTGLGLMIARDLVRSMGGDITVRSDLGFGTQFDVSIPAPVAERPATTNLAEGGLPDLVGRHILVVDDTRTNRIIVRNFLKPTGALVTEAEDGLEALDLVASTTPDIVLVDMHMPHMDGDELTARLRKMPRFDATRFVLLSAVGIETHDAFDAILPKPLNRADLMSLLTALLGSDDGASGMRASA